MSVYVLELGGEDDRFAIAEAGNAATDIDPLAPALAQARSVDPDAARGLAYTHRVSECIGTAEPTVASARSLLEKAEIARTGSVAVRARDVRGSVGIDTRTVERQLGQTLAEMGFSIDLEDPDHTLRAVFSAGFEVEQHRPKNDIGWSDPACALGWIVAESVRDFGSRQPTKKPFFSPGGMDPLLARAVANLVGAGPSTTVLDPMCGTGGILVEAGLIGSDVLGMDVQRSMVEGAYTNLERYLRPATGAAGESGSWGLFQGDATAVPLRSNAVDGVIFDIPYGRQSKIASESVDDLLDAALVEAVRVGERIVVITDGDNADLVRSFEVSPSAAFERYVHGSLTRHVFVLDPTD